MLAAFTTASIPMLSIAADPPSISGAFMWGDSNSEFLKNSFRALGPSTYTFVDYASTSERVWLRATAADPSMRWNFIFAAPPGEALAEGLYTDARHALAPRSVGVPGIYFYGESGGCSDSRGAFNIAELVRDAQGKLMRFAATFDHSCASSASNGFDRGEVRFQSTLGWAGWTISTEPFSAFNYASTAVGETSAAKEVLVTNPSTDSVFVNPHFIGSNPSDFVFTDSQHCLGELPAGAECRFGVAFAPTATGNRAAQLKVATDVRSTYKLVNLTGTATPVDTTAPSVSAVFNNGNGYTNKNVIPVHFDATDASALGVRYMALCGTSQVSPLGSVDCPAGASGFLADFNYDLTRASNNNAPGDGVKTIYYNVADQWNHWSPVQSGTVIYDTTAPSGVTPTIGIAPGRFSSKIPVQLTWPVATDNLSGIAAYRLQRKVNAGSMVTLNGSTPLAMSYSEQLTVGTKYGYQMRALDRAGNGGAWSTPFYCLPTVLDDGGAASVKTGTWTSALVSDSSGGRVLRTTKGGSSISTTFAGRSFAWVSTMGPTMGQAKIYVDGATQPIATVDLYAASRTTRQIVWSTNFTAGGTHTIKIVAVGTTGRPAVDVDAFLVLRNP